MRQARRLIQCVWLVTLCLAACAPKNPATGVTPDKSAASSNQTPVIQVVPVVSQDLKRNLRLPGELTAYQDVALYPKLSGFVESISVDLGSKVKPGQVLIRLKAPELAAQRNEAEAKANAVKEQRLQSEARQRSVAAQRVEAEAKATEAEATLKHLSAAAQTPGVVAALDLEIAQKKVEAARAQVAVLEANQSAAQAETEVYRQNETAAREAVKAVEAYGDYLTITAPFEGVITERNVHPGSLVLPSNSPAVPPLLRLRQVSRLRLTVAVPEIQIAGIKPATEITFTVPAFPGEPFTGTIRRIGDALDPKSRTLPIELDVNNPSGRLSPGMFPEVNLPVARPQATFFVPPSAVASTTERTFVVRVRDGVAEWVDVKRGQSLEKLVEVFGQLEAGDRVAVRGTDELRPGTRVTVQSPDQPPLPK